MTAWLGTTTCRLTGCRPIQAASFPHQKAIQTLFSNDQNIETIGQLIETLRHYIGLQSEFVKLDVVEKIVRLLTAVLMMGILSLLLILVILFLSLSAVHALSAIMGLPCAFLAIAGCYLAVFVLFIIFRRQWIEKPLVRLLAGILMQK